MQMLPGTESCGLQHLVDPPVEAIDHAVGLRVPWLDQAVFHAVGDADLIEGMLAGRFALTGGAKATRERFAIVGEDLGDFERGGLQEAFEEGAGMLGRFGQQDLHVDPARGAIDGGEKVFALILLGIGGKYFTSTCTKPGS